ncbi:hypothetical protein TNCV_2119551 [Trichonephila clavipes]|nr:hypothetical protein TNCV_2119551 [Trichonephila clavipes]
MMIGYDKSLSRSVFLYAFRFSSWYPWKGKRNTYRCGQRTVRIAVMACSQKQGSLARRRSKSTKLKLLDM